MIIYLTPNKLCVGVCSRLQGIHGPSASTSEEQLLGYFVGGLQQEVKCRIRPQNPKEMFRAIDLVREVEEEMLTMQVLVLIIAVEGVLYHTWASIQW